MSKTNFSDILSKSSTSAYLVLDFLFGFGGHDDSKSRILVRGKNLRRKKKGFIFVADGSCSSCPHLAVQVLLDREDFVRVKDDVQVLCKLGRQAVSQILEQKDPVERRYLADAWYKGHLYHHGKIVRAW